MEVITIESQAFQELLKKIETLKSSLKPSSSNVDTWLSTQEVQTLLKVSKRTLQTYREKGIIPYSQFGAKIYFKEKDVLLHLDRNYVKSSNVKD